MSEENTYGKWSRRFRRLATDPVGVMRGLKTRAKAAVINDPTLFFPPPGYYGPEAAREVYGAAFTRCFEYLTSVQIAGEVLEFGTLRGFTARLLAEIIKKFNYPANLYLYDSFEGLPEIETDVDRRSYEVSVNKVWYKGSMALETGIDEQIMRSLSTVLPPARIKIVKGYFEDTLDGGLPAAKAALAHVDCDLYSSAKTVLEKLIEKDILQDGCLLLFDDYNCNRASPLMGERRAMAEVFGAQDRWSFSPFINYGWHGMIFFVHDMRAADSIDSGDSK